MKKDKPPESFEDAVKKAVHKSANNPLAPPHVREAMRRVEKDLNKRN